MFYNCVIENTCWEERLSYRLIIVYHEIIMTNLDLIYKHTIKWPWMNDVNYGTLIPIRIILLHRLCDLSIVIQKYI